MGTSNVYKTIIAVLLWSVLIAISGQASAQAETWTTKAPMQTTRYYPGAAVLDGRLYVVGGCPAGNCTGGVGVTSTSEAYDPGPDTWTAKASMGTARGWLAAGEINGRLYAVGGRSPAGPLGLATLEVYDPATDAWATKTPMPTGRHGLAAGVIDQKLYVVGGVVGSLGPPGSVVATLEVYDPETDTWTAKAPMPTARGFVAAGVIDGKLYVVGGLTGSRALLATLEVYDPQADSWTTRSPMPTARVVPGVGVISGKLYVVGGSTASSLLPLEVFNTLEVYDPATDSWTTATPMPTPRYGPGAGVINGTLYVAGGVEVDIPVANVEALTPGIVVTIDIKPGSFPNSINLGSRGVVPVAILTTRDFNVNSVAPDTVVFAGASAVRFAFEDVDADGDVDLIFHFRTQDLQLTPSSTQATLTGQTVGGAPFAGTDSVRIVH